MEVQKEYKKRQVFSSHLNSPAQGLEDAVKRIMLDSIRDTDSKLAGQWHGRQINFVFPLDSQKFKAISNITAFP